ncbi:MAG: hypothetical protein JWN12_244 [Candidatus Saccharibacteria bacterium]|nr:hypothetical protein [Candidatus Saccharibacteria bacterium]
MVSFYVCAIITAGSAFTSFGFSIAALMPAHGETRTNAMYAAARSIALATISLIPFFYQSIPFLMAIALTMIVVQTADAIIGIRLRDNKKTYGPATIAVFNLMALIWLLH